MPDLTLLSMGRRILLFALVVMSAPVARANSLTSYDQAKYYGPTQLSGNLESPVGLWVSSPDDPLAYLYGYIPGIFGGDGDPYFGSGNFELIPVLLTHPTLSLGQISLILGDTPLPTGGQVLDLSAATTAFMADSGSMGTLAITKEPGTIWLTLTGILGLTTLFRRLRQPVRWLGQPVKDPA